MDLYYHIIPPPSRAVLVLAKLLNLDFNLISIDTRDSAEMAILTKVNPLQSLPTLVDGDITVGEPHAVLLYLASRFDSAGTLYPSDIRGRSAVNQCLFFDTNLYKCFVAYAMPVVIKRLPPDQELFDKLLSCVRGLDTFLEGRLYAAGDQFTLADLCLAHSIAALAVIKVPLDDDFRNVARWFGRVRAEMANFDELHGRAEEALRAFLARQKQQQGAAC